MNKPNKSCMKDDIPMQNKVVTKAPLRSISMPHTLSDPSRKRCAHMRHNNNNPTIDWISIIIDLPLNKDLNKSPPISPITPTEIRTFSGRKSFSVETELSLLVYDTFFVFFLGAATSCVVVILSEGIAT